MPSSSPSLKRTYSEAELEHSSPENGATIVNVPASPSRPPSLNLYIQHSPMASDTVDQLNPTITTSQSSTHPDAQSSAALACPSVSDPPKKRTKLTSAEKEVKRFEKEEKEKQKAEQKAKKEGEKARREEEKAKKDEEKKAKDAEKEEKRKAKEEQNRLKEEEKRKKEEEKRKKEDEKDKKAKVT